MSSRAQSLEPTCPIGDRQSMGTNEATRDPQSSSLSSPGNASVPPLSQGTSSDARSSFPARHTLPVFALRARIVDKIRENRVTLVIGDTGCGIAFFYLFCLLACFLFWCSFLVHVNRDWFSPFLFCLFPTCFLFEEYFVPKSNIACWFSDGSIGETSLRCVLFGINRTD